MKCAKLTSKETTRRSCGLPEVNYNIALKIKYYKNEEFDKISADDGSLIIWAVMNSTAQTKVIIYTNVGEISVILFDADAPNTVDNFLSYIERGDYTNTIFHRAVTDFVLQSGG